MGAIGSHFLTPLLPTVAINGHDLRSWLMYGLTSIVNMLIVNMLNAAIVNMLIDSSCNL